ncbi:MAG: VOC family protein [Rhizobiales bacterium]|nr:VOC family protein [Hyphomicrobiales bacterium]
MIGYITIGTNDIEKSAKFYDELFKVLGIGRMMDFEGYVAWGKKDGSAGFSITKPFDGKHATVGNGVMIGLAASSTEEVDKVYKKAMELGAIDEGPAGYRDEMKGFYAGYFRDLDGNKINIHYISMEDLNDFVSNS